MYYETLTSGPLLSSVTGYILLNRVRAYLLFSWQLGFRRSDGLQTRDEALSRRDTERISLSRVQS